MKFKLPQLTVQRKMYMTIIVIAFSMVIAGAFAIYKINQLSQLNQRILPQPYVVGLVLKEIENAVISIDRDIRLLPYAQDKFDRFNLLALTAEADKKILSELYIIEKRLPESKDSVEQLRMLVLKWRLLRRKINDFIELGKVKEGKSFVEHEHSRFVAQISYYLTTMKEAEAGTAFTLSKLSREASEKSILQISITFAISVIIIGGLIFMISRSIVKPTLEISQVMKDIADKKQHLTIPHTERIDEIGTIARSTETFREYSISVIKLNEQLQYVDKLKAQFFAKMNHEMRTPLNGIMGMCQILKLSKLSDKQTEKVDAMFGCTKDLLNIVNDLLDFSQLEAQTMEFTYSQFDLRDLVDNVISSRYERAKNNLIMLSSYVQRNVGETHIGDAVRIRQILHYMIDNAIKFTEKGTITLFVETQNNDRLLFRVKDTGIGIAPEHQQIIFDKFRQVDGSETRRHGGTGIGLAICKELVQHMDGEIGVESTLHEGSEFWFSIPVKEVHSSSIEKPATVA